MSNDPAPNGDVPIGVGIVDHHAAAEDHFGVDENAEKKRQGDAEAAPGRTRPF